MGHIRLGRLPRTRPWERVIGLLAHGAPVNDVAAASAKAAEVALTEAASDPALVHAIWLLTQLPLAARSNDYSGSLERLGIKAGKDPSLLAVVTAFQRAVDDHVRHVPGKTDLGEMAQLAAAESLSTFVARDLPGLFDVNADDVKLALGKLAAPDRFARLARDFFSRLVWRSLEYFVSREIANHVGPGRGLRSIESHVEFRQALEQHCREASLIVEAFAGGWYSKTNFNGGITPKKAAGFAHVAFKKLRAELSARAATDA